MGRAPCCDKMGLKKGPWSAEEDQILTSYILKHGHPNWRALPKQAGLLRCGKSCRLRWVNYLNPDIKRGHFTPQEEQTIIKLHQLMGNRWSAIAAKLPGRTDNEIKNIWHTHLKKKLMTNTYKSHTSTSIDSNYQQQQEPAQQQQSTTTYSSSTTTTSTTTSGSPPDHHEIDDDHLVVIDESFWSETCLMQVDNHDINSSSSSSYNNNIFSQAATASHFDQFLTTDDYDRNTANHLEGIISSSNTSSLPHHAAATVDDHDSDFWYNVFLAADIDCGSIHNLLQF